MNPVKSKGHSYYTYFSNQVIFFYFFFTKHNTPHHKPTIT